MSNTRDFESSLEGFRSMPDSEWKGLLSSLFSGGILEPEEQKAFEIVMQERGLTRKECKWR